MAVTAVGLLGLVALFLAWLWTQIRLERAERKAEFFNCLVKNYEKTVDDCQRANKAWQDLSCDLIWQREDLPSDPTEQEAFEWLGRRFARGYRNAVVECDWVSAPREHMMHGPLREDR